MIIAAINNYPISKIPGTASINDDGEFITNPADQSCFPKSLDDLAMPKWNALPFEKYEKIASPHGVNVIDRGAERYAPIMTSRGCPFKCNFCNAGDAYYNKVNQFSNSYVDEELTYTAKKSNKYLHQGFLTK